MESVHEKSIRMAEEWLDNVDEDVFISEYKDIVERQRITNDKKELTEFDIFEALDRTHTIQGMVEDLLGFADEYPDETTSVHRAIKKHHILLRNVQDNLAELYQKLGEDLDKLCEKKESDALVALIKIAQDDVANGNTFTVEEAIQRMKDQRGKQ